MSSNVSPQPVHEVDPLSGVQIFICTVGIIANLVIIVLIIFAKEYNKSITFWYVMQLAVSDALFLLIIPFKVAGRVYGEWIFGVAGCKITEGLIFINYYASIMFLVVMSVDRYLAVCHSFSSSVQKLRKQSTAFIATILIWVLAILLTVPVMYFSILSDDENLTCQCGLDFSPKRNWYQHCLSIAGNDSRGMRRCEAEKSKVADNLCSSSTTTSPGVTNSSLNDFQNFLNNFNIGGTSNLFGQVGRLPGGVARAATTQPPKTTSAAERSLNTKGYVVYLWFNFVVMYLIPVLVMSVCYGLICRQFWKTTVPNKSSAAKAAHDRRRVTLICVILVASFTLSWLMFHTVHIRSLITGKSDGLLIRISFTLAFINSALNPFLYSFLGTGCRRKWQSIRGSEAGQKMMPAGTKSTNASGFSRRKSKTMKESSFVIGPAAENQIEMQETDKNGKLTEQ